MDLRVSHGLSDSLVAARATKKDSAAYAKTAAPAQSENLPAIVPTAPVGGTRLISETQDDIENGLRRVRTFEQEDGRKFTRIEEITLTAQSARRTVIQQNPSGGITRYEEVLDRQGSSFRRTQRFQDESGEVATQITPDYKVTDPFILTGGYTPAFAQSSPFDANRGTQLDLQV